MKELISMVDFVLTENATNNYGHTLGRILNYAEFLNTPLNIGMFVPAVKVDGKWVVLEKPKEENYIFGVGDKPRKMILDHQYNKDLEQYQKAKDNVLFEGKEIVVNIWEFYENKTIQSLIKHKYTLTKKGLEISGLNR